MNKHIKNLLVAAGLLALGVSSANAAPYATVGGTYNTALRLDGGATPNSAGAVWSTLTPYEGRYLNNNFSSSGNLLVATGTSGQGSTDLFELNPTTGAVVNNGNPSANPTTTTTRSLVEANGYYFYSANSAGQIYSVSTSGANFSGTAGLTTSLSGVQSLVANGNKLYAATDSTITRYSVGSGGALSVDWTSTGSFAGGQVRGISYSSAYNGVYVYSASGSTFVSDNGGSGSASSFSITGFGSFEFLTGFTFSGKNYLAYRNNSGYLALSEMSGATTIAATDLYNIINSPYINAGDARGFSVSESAGKVYLSETGSSGPFAVHAYNLTAVPEPSTYAMMALGLVMSAYGLKISRRKKQSVNKA